ncbi:YkvA family protein [Methylomarinum sp. Ch1-1]|uniref:YkvA family protein n=1 Tax=Methylomarinum roseum TaxID=3067653 RepID=A0AAU7NRM7_9GAMM|nr:YkvA family protein [Methylomarinum sp. Ch1-1]MDP4520415.1 YkvA family protein [Methylomarinum sp. Ch1-1]
MNVDDKNRRAKDGLNQAFFKRNGKKMTGRHFDRIIEKAREIEAKAKSIPALHKVIKDVLLCLELIRDYRSGVYKDIETWAIVAVAFGLLYLINPVELIPDFIPVVGYLDDVAVMVVVLKLVKVEIDKYAQWREKRSEYEDAFGRLLNHDRDGN